MDTIREVTYLSVALRIGAAVILGGFIGLERGLKNRAAGLRTYMLVCVGACLIMLTNQYIFQIYGMGDPVRMGAQVVSGIGFLGAGTIIVTRRSQIKGLTTAAGLWAAAGVGLALGIGFYEAAAIGGVAIFTVMTLMQRMDNRMRMKTRRVDVYIEVRKDHPLGDFLRSLRERKMELSNLQRERDLDSQSDIHAYTATLRVEKRRNHADIMADVQAISGVEYIEEL